MIDRTLTAEYKEFLRDNVSRIKRSVENAADSNEKKQKVTILAATKTVPADVINYVTSELGITDIGENRVQELIDKYDDLDLDGVKLHFIGKLQTNKVKYIIDKVDMIHSLDSIKLAAEIDSRAKKINKIMDVLVEVNIGREENKSGIMPEEVGDFIKNLQPFDNIKVKGLMTIAPVCKTQNEYKKYFRETYSIFIDNLQNKLHNIDMESLSMGMSDSFVAAIEEGSNIVRIGSSIFGSRY